jgi:hypothetical protein
VNWKDRYVTLATGEQKNASVAMPTNGTSFVVVWEDYRSGGSDIYAQMIDARTGLALWPALDGVPVCTIAGDQRNPRAAYDTLGGVIITWEDYRSAYDVNGVDWNVQIFAHRIILNGGTLDLVWSPSPDGIPVCAPADGNARRPRIAGTGEGAYIAWTDYRNSFPLLTGDVDVFATYILSATAAFPGPTTTTNPNWAQDGDRIASASGGQRDPEIALDNAWQYHGDDPITNDPINRLGVIIVYQDDGPLNPDWVLFSTRIDRMGYQLPNGAGIIIDNAAGGTMQNHRVCTTGGVPGAMNANGIPSLGAVAVWEDYRNAATDAAAYAVLILPTGVSTNNSVQLAYNANQSCLEPKVAVFDQAPPAASTAVVVWDQDNAAGGTAKDIYANYLDLTTGLASAPNGVAVCSDAANQEQSALDVYTRQGFTTAVVGWVDERTPAWSGGWPYASGKDIYCQEIDLGSFQIMKAADGIPVTDAQWDQTAPSVSKDAFVWDDSRRGQVKLDLQTDGNIYCQKLGDECDVRNGMEWQDCYAEWNSLGITQDHEFVVDDSGGTFVVWYAEHLNPATMTTESGIFVQKFDRYGVPRWTNDGIFVSDPLYLSEKPSVCTTLDGGCYVAWEETNGAGIMVKLVYVNVDGTIRWTAYQDGGTVGYHNPRLVEDDLGGAFVASKVVAIVNDDLEVSRFSSVGVETGPVAVTANVTKHKICKDREYGCYIASDPGGDLSVDHVDNALIVFIPGLTAIAVNEFDLCVDYLPDATYSTYDALVAYTIPLGQVVAEKYQNTTNPATGVVAKIGATAIGVGGAPSSPVISPDWRVTGDLDGGGMIVAWDEETSGGSPTHEVWTQRVTYDAIGVQITSFNPGPLNLASGCVQHTHPDVATPSMWPFAVVVWQDDRQGYWCTHPSAIVAQYVNYLIPAPVPTPLNYPKVWDSDGVEVSPNTGQGVSQRLPMTKQLYFPGVENPIAASVEVFWLDDRSGIPGVIGTRMTNWMNVWPDAWLYKDRVGRSGPVQTVSTLDQNHPNPVSTSARGVTTITFALAREAHARLMVFDALGREVSTLLDADLPAGRHSAEFIPRTPAGTPLPRGVYYYTLTADGFRETRAMTIR